MKKYILAFRRAFDFKGRSSRKEYWSFVGINFIVYFILILLIGLADGDEDFESLFGGILLLYYIVTIIPSLSISIRRVHDTNRAWYFILIPYVNIVLMFMSGDKHDNNFGEVYDINKISNKTYVNSPQLVNSHNNNIFCPYCGSSVSEKVKFCSNCGKSLQNKSGNKICPVCHKEYPADTIYCEECGNKLK